MLTSYANIVSTPQCGLMDTIRILGGGISGLTAAINLQKAGCDVEVHERKDYCGKDTNDFQFLENWIFHENVLDFLRKINIRTDFYIKPWYSLEILSPSLREYIGGSTEPFMYLVKRGQVKDSIDKSLETQALNNKIKILYNSHLEPHEADIIATGPKKPDWVATGIKFRCKYPDKAVVLLNNDLSFQIYSYLIVSDNVGQIACVNPFGTKNIKARLSLTIKNFREKYNIEIKSIMERVIGTVNIHYLNKAKINNQYLIGEAAGFQDCLAGFGMTYAFKSGYYAAKSIIGNLDYDRLWKGDFLKQLRISSRNRALYERLYNERFEKLINILNSKNFMITRLIGSKDLQHILRNLYHNSLPLPLRPLIFW